MSMTKQEDAAMNQQVASNIASLCKSASRINATFRVSVDYGRVRLQAMVLNRLVIQASMPTSSVFVARTTPATQIQPEVPKVFFLHPLLFMTAKRHGGACAWPSQLTVHPLNWGRSPKYHACHAKSRGATGVPLRRQGSADIYKGLQSTTPATQIQPEAPKVPRLPRKKPRRHRGPASSPRFRGHLQRPPKYHTCHANPA